MKANALRTLVMLALVLATTAATSVASESRVTFHIPFAFAVGDRTLPAGTYAVQALLPRCLSLTGVEGDEQAATVMTTSVDSDRAETRGRLVFRRYGDRLFLTQAWMPGREVGLKLPPSAAERAIIKQRAERPGSPLAASTPDFEEVTLLACR